MSQLPRRAALELAPSCCYFMQGRQVLRRASTNWPHACRYVPNPTTTNRAFGARATTSGQAARSRSTPFETINLPT